MDAADQLRRVMREAYDDLIEVASAPEFHKLLHELYSLPKAGRVDFVNEVILNPDQLRERGVVIPEGVLVQRSSFGDRRPTLFCIKKYIEESSDTRWQNVNITFDNEFDDKAVPRDELAWRQPLPFDEQQTLAKGE